MRRHDYIYIDLNFAAVHETGSGFTYEKWSHALLFYKFKFPLAQSMGLCYYLVAALIAQSAERAAVNR